MVIIGSPVSDDSSTCRLDDLTRSPSAGISSPTSTNTMSPTTMSRRATSTTLPSRHTFTGCSSLRAVSTLNFFAASRSKMKPMVVARKMAMNMPIVSTKSPSTNANTRDITAATRRIRIIGSWYFSIYSFHILTGFGGVSTFSPCSLRLCSTWLAERPPTATASVSNVSFIMFMSIMPKRSLSDA